MGGGRDLQSVTFDDDGTLPGFVTNVTGGTTTRTAGSNGQSTPVASTITVEAPCAAGASARTAPRSRQGRPFSTSPRRSVAPSHQHGGRRRVHGMGQHHRHGHELGAQLRYERAPTVAAGGLHDGAEGSDISIDGSLGERSGQ